MNELSWKTGAYDDVELSGAAYATRIWSLNCDGVDGNLRYLDLATLDSPASRCSSGEGPGPEMTETAG